MLKYQIRVLRTIFPKPMKFYSTTGTPSISLQPEANSLIQKLSKEFNDIRPVMNILEEDDVRNIGFNDWKTRIEALRKYQFTDLECLKMISLYPLLLKIPLPQLEETVRQWFSAELGSKNFENLLLSQPALLDISSDVIKCRIPQLRVLFRTSTALAELLINSPNIMFDQWEVVLKKIQYLLKDKKYTIGEVLQASALSKSLYLIKFRHDLLEKCGIYRTETLPLHKINKHDKSRHKNPHLKDILVTNAHDFSKLAKISTEEYAVCRDLYMLNENDEYDSDDD